MSHQVEGIANEAHLICRLIRDEGFAAKVGASGVKIGSSEDRIRGSGDKIGGLYGKD